MPKINYRRKSWKLRKPVPNIPNKVIDPEVIYNRHREKRLIKILMEIGVYDETD